MAHFGCPAYFVDGKPEIPKGRACWDSCRVASLSLTLRNDPALLHVDYTLCLHSARVHLEASSLGLHICESPFPFLWLQETSEAVGSPRPAASWGAPLGARVAGRAPRITQDSCTPQYGWLTFCNISTR